MGSSSVQTVSGLSVLFMVITLLLSFGVPIGLAIFAKVKYKKAFSFIPLLFGMLCFFVSQIIFRLPIMQYLLPMFGWYKKFMDMKWLFLIVTCFTAGLVEEPARFIAFSIMKKRRQFVDGLSYGIGHGGIEAILLIGLTYVGNLMLAVMINAGSLGAKGIALPPATVTALTATSPYLFLVAGVERVFAVTLHIALSLVVLKGFQVNKKALYLAISIVLHGLANFAAIGAAQLGAKMMAGNAQLGGVLASEGVLLVVAAVSLFYIIKQARAWRRSLSPAGEVNYELPGQTDAP